MGILNAQVERLTNRRSGTTQSEGNALSSTLAGRLRRPRHVWVKPDRQRPAALQRLVVRGPSQHLCNRAMPSRRNQLIPKTFTSTLHKTFVRNLGSA